MPTVTPVSDFQLQVLSEEPPDDLFPMLTSSVAFGPWVVMLAFLPSLAGVFQWTLDDRSAEWGLRGLDWAASAEGHESLWRGEIDSPRLRGAPPLATWLTGLLLRINLPMPLGLTAVSYLSVAMAILFAGKLSRRLGVPRLASLAVLCCAGSPLLLNSAHAAGPEALGLCLMTVSLERFLAHLDASIGWWSGRLFVSALAWGGCWLALGWPALCLGVALTVPAFSASRRRSQSAATAEFPPVGLTPQQVYRRSLVPWWILGAALGLWWMSRTILDAGLGSTFAWLLDPQPNMIAPMFHFSSQTGRWGATVGRMFMLGWVVLGIVALVRNSPKVFGNTGDGRRLAILWWWGALICCRIATAAAGGDPTLWDVLQTVPVCIIASAGMETVIQRSVSATLLLLGVVVGLLSLAIHVPHVDSPPLRVAVALGAVVLLGPIFVNLAQARSFIWKEPEIRRLLQGLLTSTWLAQLVWGIAQSMSDSTANMELTTQLAKLKSSLSKPGAIVVVSQAEPSPVLEFLLRRTWPDAPLLVADRWESAVSRTLAAVGNWADSEFLVVELARRDSQFRRPGMGWIVNPVGEPRRYLSDQLTLNRVSVQSP